MRKNSEAKGSKVFLPEQVGEVEPFRLGKLEEGFSKAIARQKWRRVNGKGFYVTTVFWYA